MGGNLPDAQFVESWYHTEYGLPWLEQPETTWVMLNYSGAMEINQPSQEGSIPQLSKAVGICLLASGQYNTIRQDHEVKENVCILKPNEILGEVPEHVSKFFLQGEGTKFH